MARAAVTVPVYFNESPDRMTYILNHCGAQVVFLSGASQLQKFLQDKESLKELQHVVVANAGETIPAEFLRYETLIAATGGGRDCGVPYACGTGAARSTGFADLYLGHDWRAERRDADAPEFQLERYGLVQRTDQLKPETDLAVSFFPLAHVYGRMLDYLYIFQGCPVAYVEVVENVAQALLEVKPTMLAAVPRFFEKIYARLMEKGSQSTGHKAKDI